MLKNPKCQISSAFSLKMFTAGIRCSLLLYFLFYFIFSLAKKINPGFHMILAPVFWRDNREKQSKWSVSFLSAFG